MCRIMEYNGSWNCFEHNCSWGAIINAHPCCGELQKRIAMLEAELKVCQQQLAVSRVENARYIEVTDKMMDRAEKGNDLLTAEVERLRSENAALWRRQQNPGTTYVEAK